MSVVQTSPRCRQIIHGDTTTRFSSQSLLLARPERLRVARSLSPDGSGTIRSNARSLHRLLGKVVALTGGVVETGVTDWHPGHCLQCLSTMLFMLGHHTLLRRPSFIVTIPWWPSWAKLSIYSCKFAETKICILFITYLPIIILSSRNSLCELGVVHQSPVFQQRCTSVVPYPQQKLSLFDG